MCELLIFDDDTRKIALTDRVLDSLNASYASVSWSIGYKVRIASFVSVNNFLGKLETQRILIILDIEITKEDHDSDWRAEAVAAIQSKLDKSESLQFQKKYSSLTAVYGNHIDYQLSLNLLAYLLIRRVPVITISTKANADDDVQNIEKARAVGVPYIPNWSESWETSWIIEDRKVRILAGIAAQINTEWQKRCGEIDKRIWHSSCLMPVQGNQTQGDTQEWFKRGAEHPHMKHDTPTNPTADYLANMRGFLDSVINKNKSKPIDFSNYEITKGCHEAIKSLIGAVSNADFATTKDKVPELNTVVLLAAAWDPNAASWFPSFKWEVSHQLMSETATKQQLRTAINAIGGEEGLFQTKLIDKENNAPNADGNWSPNQSFVKNVTVTRDSVTIQFKAELSKLAVNFALAKEGKPFTG